MTATTTPSRTRLAVSAAEAITRDNVARRGDRVRNGVFLAVLMLAVSVAVVSLAALLIWSFIRGFPRLDLALFTNAPSSINPGQAGFRTAILGTLWVVGGVILAIIPLGVGSAVYLEQYANPIRRWNRIVDLNIQNLAGVPSIVYGILGLGFIVRGPISLGFVAAAGSLTVALLVLPTIIIASREAIRAVPSSIADGSFALGATRWQTIRRIILPSALPGILTGVILSVSRAVGEAAPLLLVGAVTFVTFNPKPFADGYSALPVMIYQYSTRPQEEFRILAAAGVIVMLAIVLGMNALAVWLRHRYERRW